MEKYNLTTDAQELMTYSRQGIRSQTSVLPSMGTIPEARELTLQDRSHSLLNFVSRPIDVYKGVWDLTSNNTASSELIPGGLLFPDLLYQNPQYQEKMRGFVGLKGHIKVRILFNAQKFQQGILMAYWIPNYTNLVSKAELIQASLSGKSGCAHVMINCEGGTEQTIEIPYVNQHTFYNSTTNQGNYGALFLTVLLPLRSSLATDSVGFRIQAWIENPELEYPTAVLPVITQGFEEEGMHSDTINVGDGSGLSIDNVITDLANVSMKPSYLARNAANLMQLAGFQKPTNESAICRSSLRTNSFMSNFNGEHMAHKMALSATNELLPMDAPAGSTLDEMNITNICKAPTYYQTFSVSTTNAENYVLYSDNVHPAKFTPASPPGVLNSTFLGYTSSVFGQWRGSIKYDFLVAKTGFHSGTVRVTYVPGLYSPLPDPTAIPANINLDRCYQETYDLRDMTEFSFTVPYTTTREYLNVVNPFSSSAGDTKVYNYSTGMIIVDVFVPVRAPDTVNQTFDIAVFISGGDDINFANPTAPIIFPYAAPAVAAASSTRRWRGIDVQTQGISFDQQHDRVEAINSSTELIGAAKPKMNLSASAYCTGEVITSIKNLMGRFGPYYFPPVGSTSVFWTIAPFDFQAPISNGANAVTFDYIDFFSYLFAFYRGGVRISMDPGINDARFSNTYHVQMRSALDNYYPLTSIPRGLVSPLPPLTTIPPSQREKSPFSLIISKPSIEGLVDIEVPYYALSHVTPVLVQEQTRDLVQESDYPFPIVSFSPYSFSPANNVSNPRFYRAASDDFRFHYMLGPPQVTFLESDIVTAPILDENIDFYSQPVTRSGNNLSGLFGYSPFPLPTNPIEANFEPPNEFIGVTSGNDAVFFLPRNVRYGFSLSGNQVLLSSTNFSLPSGLRMISSVPAKDFNSSGVGLAWTKTTTLTVLPGGTQSTPVSAVKFETENVTVDTGFTSIIIPNQQPGAITFGTNFVLTRPLMVAYGESTTFANQAYVLLNANLTVRFSRHIIESINTIAVSATNGEVLGYLIRNLRSNPGFADGVPIFSPTRVVQSPVP